MDRWPARNGALLTGFFYHARMLAIVHLVTLGWITASILGSLYIVGPIALRVWIPPTWLDYTAFALVLIGGFNVAPASSGTARHVCEDHIVRTIPWETIQISTADESDGPRDKDYGEPDQMQGGEPSCMLSGNLAMNS